MLRGHGYGGAGLLFAVPIAYLNAFGFTYLSPNDSSRVYADAAKKRQKSVEAAALVDLFRILAGCHARQEIR